MKKTYYEKQGRRYIPVAEYDSDHMDSFPGGSHLVMCYPGGQSRRFNIDPAYAPMIAAGRIAGDTISTALMRASDIRMQGPGRELTPEQREAWENLVDKFGPSARMLEWPSAREVADQAVKAMQEEAMALMQHESVKQAYDHFMLVCELTRTENKK